MNQLILKRHIRVIFLAGFILFLLNKFVLRPWILANDAPQFLKVIAWSIPNLIEAVMGSILLTGALFYLQNKLVSLQKQLVDVSIYLIAVSFANTYVLTQEIKWHHLGGRNVYDPNDFMASVLGILFIFGVLCKYGFRENKE